MKKYPLIGKGLAVGIILLFVGTCIIPVIAQDTEKPLPTSRGNWLYVGGSGHGNYTKIQDAINASSDGDTIFVYDDSSPYFEEIIIEKSINLLGENHNTVIDGMTEIWYGIEVKTDYVTIDCFTISNFSNGIHIYQSNNAMINNIHSINNLFGMSLHEAKNNIISNNIMKNCRNVGLSLYKTSNNLIRQNKITGCAEGIGFYLFSSDDTIINNEITKNHQAIHSEGFDSDYHYAKCRIENIIIQYNNITDNTIGIEIYGKFKNCLIENNNFIKNKQNIHYDIFLFHRLSINKNFWDRIKLLPQLLPGLASIYLFTNNVNPKNPFDVFLNIPKIVFDWHPAQQPYDIPGIS